MAAKSFYDLDYIIELNEGRLTQITDQYEKAQGRFTNVLVVYSAITIFLLPTVQDLISAKVHSPFFVVAFALFSLLFLVSVYYTVRLLIPINMAYLNKPVFYYDDYRRKYEEQLDSQDAAIIDPVIKASYIGELESAIDACDSALLRKQAFFAGALRFALLCVLPYLVCLGFHLTIKEEQVQKVQIISAPKSVP